MPRASRAAVCGIGTASSGSTEIRSGAVLLPGGAGRDGRFIVLVPGLERPCSVVRYYCGFRLLLQIEIRGANGLAVFVVSLADVFGEFAAAHPDRIKALQRELRLHLG